MKKTSIVSIICTTVVGIFFLEYLTHVFSPSHTQQDLTVLTSTAEQGNASAQNNLGNAYEEGKGVTKSYEEALKWYQKAAEQGHAGAQDNLGTLYALGQGVPVDYTQAIKWYTKAAEQGLDLAENNLGVIYANGRGVQKDYIQGYKWFALAVAQGNPDATKALGALNGLMTHEQIEEGKHLVREWEQMHLKQ